MDSDALLYIKVLCKCLDNFKIWFQWLDVCRITLAFWIFSMPRLQHLNERVNNDFIIQSIISYRINNAINRRPLMECKQMIDMVMTLCNLTLYDLMHQTRWQRNLNILVSSRTPAVRIYCSLMLKPKCSFCHAIL